MVPLRGPCGGLRSNAKGRGLNRNEVFTHGSAWKEQEEGAFALVLGPGFFEFQSSGAFGRILNSGLAAGLVFTGGC